jgi:hypothetical protein
MGAYRIDPAVFRFAVAEITKVLHEDYFQFENGEVDVDWSKDNRNLQQLACKYIYEVRKNYPLYKKLAEATPKE